MSWLSEKKESWLWIYLVVPLLKIRRWLGGQDILGGNDVPCLIGHAEVEPCNCPTMPCVWKRRGNRPYHEMVVGEGFEPLKHFQSLGPEPKTIAEWIAQTKETGILEFELLLDIGIDACLHAHGMGQESAANDIYKPAVAIISELCSAVETLETGEVNQFVENARLRAREFLKQQAVGGDPVATGK